MSYIIEITEAFFKNATKATFEDPLFWHSICKIVSDYRHDKQYRNYYEAEAEILDVFPKGLSYWYVIHLLDHSDGELERYLIDNPKGAGKKFYQVGAEAFAFFGAHTKSRLVNELADAADGLWFYYNESPEAEETEEGASLTFLADEVNQQFDQVYPRDSDYHEEIAKLARQKPAEFVPPFQAYNGCRATMDRAYWQKAITGRLMSSELWSAIVKTIIDYRNDQNIDYDEAEYEVVKNQFPIGLQYLYAIHYSDPSYTDLFMSRRRNLPERSKVYFSKLANQGLNHVGLEQSANFLALLEEGADSIIASNNAALKLNYSPWYNKYWGLKIYQSLAQYANQFPDDFVFLPEMSNP